MIDGLVAKRYADALFEVAHKLNLLDEVEQDLSLMVKVISETPDFMSFLRHPQIGVEIKKGIVDSAMKNSISTISINFFYQLIDSHRVEFIEEIYKLYVKLANDVKGIVDVEAVSAVTLNEADKENVIRTFSGKFGKKVLLTNTVDPSLIGGILVKIGDRVYDGSIKKQLQVLKRSLMASRV